jgi:8-oxo-dGTP pyrophosphatase MutT (NUDIX family)
MKKIIASGPVIIENGKLLVTMDKKDDFYKIPGGTLENEESLEECAIRELNEETGFSCSLIKKLPTMKIKKKPGTNESVIVELYHYLAKLKNSVSNHKSFRYNGHLVSWLNIEGIKNGKYPISPNIKFLIEKGAISP